MRIILPHRRRSAIPALLAGVALSFFCGCHGTEPPPGPPTIDPCHTTLIRAAEAFRDGDYPGAVALFSRMTVEHHFPYKADALYGMACARLLMAESPAQHEEALSLWSEWNGRYGDPPSDPAAPPDPMHEISVLFQKRLLERLEEATFRSEMPDTPTAEEPPREGCPPTVGEIPTIGALRDLLRRREKEIQHLRRQNVRMSKAIQGLKDQIQAIEDIHQDINEKKKEMGIP